MSDLIKYGAIAIGGYFLYEWLSSSGYLGGATTGVATSPQAANPTNSSSTTNAAATLALVAAAAKAAGTDPSSYQSTDVWNFFYQGVRGVAGPAPEDLFPGVDRNTKHSISEWWGAMSGKGFSGLGMIAHFVNPYHNVSGNPFGDNIAPTGMETYIKRFS